MTMGLPHVGQISSGLILGALAAGQVTLVLTPGNAEHAMNLPKASARSMSAAGALREQASPISSPFFLVGLFFLRARSILKGSSKARMVSTQFFSPSSLVEGVLHLRGELDVHDLGEEVEAVVTVICRLGGMLSVRRSRWT